MATIRKRGESWQVQVRRDGFPAVSKSFRSKVDANAWAREAERSIDRNEPSLNDRSTRSVTVGDLLSRYSKEVSPNKRGAKFEQSRILHLKRTFLNDIKVSNLRSSCIAKYRDERLLLVSNDSVRRELTILRHCFEVARREWGIPIPTNPVRQIAIPKSSEPRDTRLSPGDYDNILKLISSMRIWYLQPLFILAIETGMRRGELTSLKWSNINLNTRVATLEKTKNGSSRTIPLSTKSIQVISGLPQADIYVFPVTGNAVRLAWERLRAKAGLKSLRFHDLRHEAISRFAELGFSIPEISLISGHKDYKSLSRYVNLRPTDIAKKWHRSIIKASFEISMTRPSCEPATASYAMANPGLSHGLVDIDG